MNYIKEIIVSGLIFLGVLSPSLGARIDSPTIHGPFYASSTGMFDGTLTLTSLADPAGVFLAVDTTGQIIATTTPAGGAQTPWTQSINAAGWNLTSLANMDWGGTLESTTGSTNAILLANTAFIAGYQETASIQVRMLGVSSDTLYLGIDGSNDIDILGGLMTLSTTSVVLINGPTTVNGEFQTSETYIQMSSGKLYDIVALDRMSIADATTTDLTAYPWGTCLRQGGPSFTIPHS